MERTMMTGLGATLAVSKETEGYCECVARSRGVKGEPRGRRSIEQHVAWKLSRFRSREKFAIPRKLSVAHSVQSGLCIDSESKLHTQKAEGKASPSPSPRVCTDSRESKRTKYRKNEIRETTERSISLQ